MRGIFLLPPFNIKALIVRTAKTASGRFWRETGKTGNKPPENPPESLRRLCFTACMSMHAVQRENSRHSAVVSPRFRRSSYPKTVNGDAIYCVAVEALRRRSRKPVSARSGIGFVDGRQSRYGNVRRTTHHTIHRRFDSWLDSRVAKVKNSLPNDDSTLESSRQKLLIV